MYSYLLTVGYKQATPIQLLILSSWLFPLFISSIQYIQWFNPYFQPNTQTSFCCLVIQLFPLGIHKINQLCWTLTYTQCTSGYLSPHYSPNISLLWLVYSPSNYILNISLVDLPMMVGQNREILFCFYIPISSYNSWLYPNVHVIMICYLKVK